NVTSRQQQQPRTDSIGVDMPIRPRLELLQVREEFADRLAYAECCIIANRIAKGEVHVVNRADFKNGRPADSTAHDYWDRERKRAEQIAERYDNLEHEDPYEIGRIEGTLSALVWVLERKPSEKEIVKVRNDFADKFL